MVRHFQSGHQYLYRFTPSSLFLINLLVGIGLVFSYAFLARNSLQDTAIKGSPFSINAGEQQSLPSIVIEMRDLAAQLDLKEFRLSPLFVNNEFLRQRSVEFLFPKKIVDSAKIVMAHKSEAQFTGCKLIGSGREINIYECN